MLVDRVDKICRSSFLVFTELITIGSARDDKVKVTARLSQKHDQLDLTGERERERGRQSDRDRERLYKVHDWLASRKSSRNLKSDQKSLRTTPISPFYNPLTDRAH